MDEILEQKLIFNQPVNTENVTEEALSLARQIVHAVGGARSVTMKAYAELV